MAADLLGFDGRVFAHARVTGVERYARELYRQFTGLGPVQLFVPGSKWAALQHLWTHVVLPPRAVRCRVAALFCPVMDAPIWLPRSIPLTVTLHDVGFLEFPEMYSRSFRAYYRAVLPAIVRRADTVICISHAAERSIARYLPGIIGKTAVVHHGIAAHFRCLRAARRPIVLCVGSLNRHKNLAAVIAAFALLDRRWPHRLVIVGAARGAVSSAADVYRALQSAPRERIDLLGHVSDEELLRLYNEAEIAVHASLMEGFGFAPLEAMACGCPVVVSDLPALREVCGEAAVYCDPLSPGDIASAMGRLLESPSLRAGHGQAGCLQARGFTWEKAAHATLAAMRGERLEPCAPLTPAADPSHAGP